MRRRTADKGGCSLFEMNAYKILGIHWIPKSDCTSERASLLSTIVFASFTLPQNVYIIRWYTQKGPYFPAHNIFWLAQIQYQILNQIQTTAVQSQRALSVARQQTSAKERERRILQLTIDEISQLESDVNMYKGVGKMCVYSHSRVSSVTDSE